MNENSRPLKQAIDSLKEHYPMASEVEKLRFILWDHIPFGYFTCHYIQDKIYVVCNFAVADILKHSEGFKDREVVEDEKEKTRILIDIGFLIEVQGGS